MRPRLVLCVDRHLGGHGGDVEDRPALDMHATVETRHRQQLPDQRVQPLRFPLDAIEVLERGRVAAAARQAQGDIERASGD